jgi:adenylate cyclase
MLMAIPWSGKQEGWPNMYDYPNYRAHAQRISIYSVWQLIEAKRRLIANERASDLALFDALALTDAKAASDYNAAPLRGIAKQELIDSTIKNLDAIIKGMAEEPDPAVREATKELLDTYKKGNRLLREVVRQNAVLGNQVVQFRKTLHQQLTGRAALIGSVATGNADKVSTSMNAQCPGVVVHGAIFNAIMTGALWRSAPPRTTYIIIVLMGVITGLLVAWLHPLKAFFATLLLLLGYLLINGYLLFGSMNLMVGISGPVMAGLLVWSGVTIPNFVTEVAERNRITRRFSNYVDPSLVNYVIEHPDQGRFLGEAREMTMGFTDLMGFTTFTESLGPRTVPLLAEYMNLMIPRIRENKGYVSRLMGDGIYFFFNAPEADPDHAMHAVMTVLSMHEALDKMNLTLPARDYPTLIMRAGLCTGKVIVGDAGSSDFNDYTAVGDSVNTAARFESANKNFGTKIMASARTIELLNGQFLVRPIGNLRVVGKTEGRQVFEPLCRLDAATPRHHEIAEISTRIVTTYQNADFAACVKAADELDKLLGPNKYAAFYRLVALEYQEKTPADFCGQIVLTEK